MKKALWLHFFCLVLLTRCEVWNQPMIFDGGDQANGLRAIHTIFIKTLPDRTVFTAEEVMKEEGIFTDEMWYDGLEVYGINGLDEMRTLLPEEYLVDPVDTSKFTGEKTEGRTVTVKLNAPDRGYDITTEFTITILKIGEKYYTILAYSDTNGAVIASPSFITDSQFEEAGDDGVSVDIIIRPADRYKLKEDSLAYSSTSSEEHILGPLADDKYNFTKSIFESKNTIYLYAEFELAEGVVEMNGVYYDALEAAIDVITADPGSDYTIRVVTGFSLSRPITIPDGRNITITLTSNDGATKTISGNITVGNDETLRLKTNTGGLIVNGTVTVSGSGSLVMSGAVSVTEVNLGSDAEITVSGKLLSSGGVQITKITGKSKGDIVLQGVDGVDGYGLTDDDCARFVVEGFAIKLDKTNNTGVLVDRVASRWVGGVERYYESIQDAITASSGTETNPDKITVLIKSIEITDAVLIDGEHVKLVPRFGSDVTLTRATTGSLFTVNSGGSLVLEGNGLKRLVIDGNGSVSAYAPLITVSDGALTINTGAELQNNNNTNYGGGYGGGVHVTSGLFTMKGGTISGNTASNGGGGVHVTSGTFTMSGGTISGNKTTGTSGAGGGVYVGSSGKFTMSDGIIGGSTTNANQATNGGGVYVAGGNFEMSAGTISYNEASYAGNTQNYGNGGGVYIANNLNSQVTFTMSGGTISNNKASKSSNGGGSGGGVYIANNTKSNKFEMSGGTISGNTATNSGGSGSTGGNGGGVYVGSGGSFEMKSGTSGTISGNTASGYNADTGGWGGGVYVDGSFTMSAGTIGGNTANDANQAANGGGVYVTGSGSSFTMSGGTISGNTATNNGGGVYVTGSGSSFTMNGGTIKGNTADSHGGGVYVAGGNFEMSAGTISYNEASYAGGTQDSGNGGGVYIANGNSKITFTMSGGTISNNKAKRDSVSNGVVGGNGGGVYIASNTSSSDITFTMSGTAEISDNTASNESTKNNTTGGNGGGVYVASSSASSTFTMSESAKISGNKAGNRGNSGSNGGNGGGVYVTGTGSSFTMSAGTISGNKMNGGSAGSGGAGAGVYVSAGGNFTMKDSAIISSNGDGTNKAGHGGAVCADGGTFAMEGGTISDNKAWNGGGVDVSNSGTFTMEGGEIKDNEATGGSIGGVTYDGDGGGVHVVSNSSFTMSGGTISGNKAPGSKGDSKGGGVYVGSGSTFTMSAGTISGNTTTNGGGGVYVTGSNSKFTMSGGTIGGNSATTGGGVYVTGISGTFTKTGGSSGGTIYGNNESDNSNTAKGDDYGHAVYVSGNPSKKRNATAVSTVDLDSSKSGSSGGWD